MYQGEATAFRLGWHPNEPPSNVANINKIYLKKGEKYIQERGLGQNPQNKKEKGNDKHQIKGIYK